VPIGLSRMPMARSRRESVPSMTGAARSLSGQSGRDEPVTVYITGFGPTDTHYIDAAADPRRP
jgi:hypothetical protein